MSVESESSVISLSLVQESDAKKCEKKEASGPPLQTASSSVRALIEEKIIQKRITTSLGAHTQTSLTYSSM